MKVSVFNRRGELVGPIDCEPVVRDEAVWRAQLTPAQYAVTRHKGTERPFCGGLVDNHRSGVYACVCCGLPLFTSETKFESGSGWPSFFRPLADGNLLLDVDRSHGMVRTEVTCVRCEAHLGHVFDDGPRPTGLRFCINGEALAFVDADRLADLADPVADSGSSRGTT